MFTVCPKCTLSLAVTAADLRVGQGYVRCGRCANVFNALLTLSEEPPPDASSTRPNLALQVEEGVGLQLDEPLPPEFVTAHEEEAELVESHGTGTFETIVLEGEGILQTEEFATEDDLHRQLAQVARQLAANEPEPPVAEPIAPADPEPTITEPQAAEPRARWTWVAATAALVLLLLAQAVNHWRDRIAASPFWYGPLTSLYGQFGVTLTPAWNLAAYDVRQLGASADGSAGNAIRVHISVANNAPRNQPLPVLKLTLLDRYGKRLAARNLPPAEYLPQGSDASRFMDAGQRVDSTIAVADPGAAATSFELDVCLPAAADALRCAGDAAPFNNP